MFIVTLLTSPARPALDPELVASLRNAWGGGDALWLSPDEAAEFPVPARPENFDEVRAECDARGVDLNIQPAGNRRKKMLIADMDSTMIGQECIDELAAEAGLGELVSAITARAMNGELDFEGALIERVALLKGLDVAVIERLLASRITPAPGAAVLVRTMKANGAYAVLVSGGFTAFAERVAERLSFDAFSANVLEVSNGRLTGEVRRPILGRNAKAEMLERTAQRLGLSVAEVIAAGDGANDLDMLNRAGMGVAIHAKPVVAAQCGLRINHGDLTALLYLQGYARADFDRTAEASLDFAV